MKQTIIVNGRFLTKPVSGVFRYSMELLNQFDTLLDEKEFKNLEIVCLTPSNAVYNTKWKNILRRQVGIFKGNLWEQVDLPFHVSGNLLFSPANIGPLFLTNQVITIHDASTFGIPDAYTWLFRLKYKIALKMHVRYAKMILTDSNFSQKELAHYLGVPHIRFNVIPLGGDHLRNINGDGCILEKSGLQTKSYLLTVASRSKHKNFASVMDAASKFQTEVEFAVVGGNYRKIFAEEVLSNIPSNVHILGYVDDNELKALYENALGFIFPSNYEGFGLPILEAMNCGCPVISSNSTSLPEVAGDAVRYFSPLVMNELICAIKDFISNPVLREKLQILGQIQSEKFTWNKTARATLTALISCL